MAKRTTLLLSLFVVHALALSGCPKEEDDDAGDSATSGVDDTGGTGSASASNSQSGTGSASNSGGSEAGSESASAGGTTCGEGGTTGEDPCPGYTACIEDNCGELIQSCYVEGPCAEYGQCVVECCGDTDCVMGCGTPSMECLACGQEVVTCQQSNCADEVCP